jgi:hypothetical protein
MDYGSSFHSLLRAEAGPAWTAYVEHAFVRGLEDGTLPRASFLHYLQQDYVYLIHYTRAWALAAAKSTSVEEMREFAGTALTLIDGEMQLHIETCKAVGISQSALEATREEPTRTESDTFGPYRGRSPTLGKDYWGAQAQRSLGNFKIGWENCSPNTRPDRARRLGIVKRAAHRRNQHGPRQDGRRAWQGDRRRRAGSDRRQARRPLPAGRLADRLRHPVQHERQRGDLQPRHRDAGRRDGLQEAGPPQRPRAT